MNLRTILHGSLKIYGRYQEFQRSVRSTTERFECCDTLETTGISGENADIR
jgi:hypothetical protein